MYFFIFPSQNRFFIFYHKKRLFFSNCKKLVIKIGFFLSLTIFIDKYKDFSYYIKHNCGGIAQLARVLDWQSRGQGFDSLYLHQKTHNAFVCFLYHNRKAAVHFIKRHRRLHFTIRIANAFSHNHFMCFLHYLLACFFFIGLLKIPYTTNLV